MSMNVDAAYATETRPSVLRECSTNCIEWFTGGRLRLVPRVWTLDGSAVLHWHRVGMECNKIEMEHVCKVGC